MPIQAKLTIGAPGDKYEQEADRVAAQVVKQINAPVASQPNQNLQREELSSSDELMMKPEIGNIQRKEEPQEDEELQMKPAVQLQASGGGMAATDELETAIQQARGGGQPLVDEVREPMEQAFGADFSGVKIHTDSQADQLNQATQARAFTTGQDVFFRQGEYNPGSRGGQELIAHELTHVVQQNGGTVHRTPLPYIQKAPKNKVLPYKTDFKTTTDFERTHVAKDSEEAEKKGGERPDGGEVLHYMKLNQISNIDKDYERKFAAHLNFDKPEQFNRPQPDVGENNYWTEGKYKIWEYDRKKGKVSEKEVKLSGLTQSWQK